MAPGCWGRLCFVTIVAGVGSPGFMAPSANAVSGPHAAMWLARSRGKAAQARIATPSAIRHLDPSLLSVPLGSRKILFDSVGSTPRFVIKVISGIMQDAPAPGCAPAPDGGLAAPPARCGAKGASVASDIGYLP